MFLGVVMSKKSDELSKLYDDMAKRARRVSAWVIMRGLEHVGTVRVHYPADGAGRLVAYVADWTLDCPVGVPFNEFTRWQRGIAGGYGYDKTSAALRGLSVGGVVLQDNGRDWVAQLHGAGLYVICAI